MGGETQGTNAGGGPAGGSATSDAERKCDCWVVSSKKYCGEPAEWRCTLFLTARLVLYRCREHCRVLQEKYRGNPDALAVERINSIW